jgi:hypothetical protein
MLRPFGRSALQAGARLVSATDACRQEPRPVMAHDSRRCSQAMRLLMYWTEEEIEADLASGIRLRATRFPKRCAHAARSDV